MNPFLAHRLSALNAVLHPETDPEYELRRIFRWYSKEFHVPLPQVYDLPLDDVLQHYYEAKYEQMEGVEPDEKDQDQRPYLIRERDFLCETPEERRRRIIEEEEDKRIGDKFQRQVEEEEEEKERKWAAKRAQAAKGARVPNTGKRPDTMDMHDLIERSVKEERRLMALADKIERTTGAVKKMAVVEEDDAPDELDLSALKRSDLPPDISMRFED